MVDANYKFIYIDVGAAARAGDAGVFADSALNKAMRTNSLDLPDAVALQGISKKISYHIVGDDAFVVTGSELCYLFMFELIVKRVIVTIGYSS